MFANLIRHGLVALGVSLVSFASAEAGDWTTITGQIVYPKAQAIPVMNVINPAVNAAQCNAAGPFSEELWMVNAKNRGLANVVVYLQHKEFKKGNVFDPKDIHPDFKNPPKEAVEIDQPCCKFIPHVVAARAGQDLVIKNSAPIPHNAKFEAKENGSVNPLIPSKGQHVINALKAEYYPVEIKCSIHGWMNAWVRVFDHPYFAVTDADGKFEIKNAPVGDYNLVIWHETGFSNGVKGKAGIPMKLVKDKTNLGELEFAK
jgi:hypothetical protein